MNYSILNLAPIRDGETFKDAIDAMIRLAQAAEEMGYERYWLAEHHNTKSIASSATALLIQAVLEHTKTIRAGAGGVMLPNHSPYVVAEYYGTLETMYPGRVDLGLGRAPGTDRATAMAIRRSGNLYSDFEAELKELKGYFEDTEPVHAYPAAGLNVPFYILGSSTDSAYVAAEMGLPYCFASHFAPAMMEKAVAIYRSRFQPSKYLDKPYVILGCNMACAETDEEAEILFTSQIRHFLDIVTGQNVGILPPAASMEEVWKELSDAVDSVPHFGPVAFNKQQLISDLKGTVNSMAACSLVGSPQTVKAQALELMKHAQYDELMINSMIYSEEAQIESFSLFAKAMDELGK